MSPADPVPSPSALLEVAAALAAEAGAVVNARQRDARVAETKTSDVDIVTQIDVEAERLIRDRLADLRPEDGILGEEGDDVTGSSGVTWVVDPIDGTVNYLYGIPHFSVSVAAVTGRPDPSHWRIEAGAVLDATGVLWTAARGEGSWRAGTSLRRHGGPSLAGSLVATGFQYTAERRAQQGQVVARLLPRIRDIRRLGSASMDLCHVAAGMVDGYYEHGLKPWDFAAAALIATESGVRVAGIDGGAPDGRLLVAAVPGTWEALRDALVDAGADAI